MKKLVLMLLSVVMSVSLFGSDYTLKSYEINYMAVTKDNLCKPIDFEMKKYIIESSIGQTTTEMLVSSKRYYDNGTVVSTVEYLNEDNVVLFLVLFDNKIECDKFLVKYNK